MSGKVLIYGGSGGIGSCSARILHEKGFDIHLVSRDEDKLEEVAGELGAGFTVGDVDDTSLFTRVMEDAGQELSGLIYAIGTIKLGSLRRLTRQDFLGDLQINAVGAALAVQAAVGALRKGSQNSSIVLFASIAAVQGFPLHASTGMAKGAVAGLTLSLAAELAPRIRVNAIAPSLTRTPLSKSILGNEKTAQSIASLHPLKRLGMPEDIAKLAAFLITPESDWITGQILSVDGGRSTLRTDG